METTPNRKKVILAVDDDEILLALYKRMFSQQNIDVLLAKDAESALKMIKQEKPAIMLLDILMPKLQGLDFLKILRNDPECKDIPVMILTNFDTPQYHSEAEALGIVDYLVKANTDSAAVVARVVKFLSQSD